MSVRQHLITLSASALAAFPAACASDWGYDDGQAQKPVSVPIKTANPATLPAQIKTSTAAPAAFKREQKAPQAVELKAGEARALNTVSRESKKETLSKQPAKVSKTSGPAGSKVSDGGGDRRINAIEDWLELFALVVKEPLSQEQKDRFRQLLEHKLTTAQSKDVYEILSYWPDVQQHLGANAEEKEAFAALFRSLLRFESRSKTICQDDATILSELLGPERIAVPGDPPLTEDSVDAYGDMACFMYEQSHAGKTVDAIDNRTVFAAVICGKFEHAPTAQDKRAMANFALTWAKFKVSYLLAGQGQRQILLQQVQSGKPPTNQEEKASLVSAIFSHGPWH